MKKKFLFLFTCLMTSFLLSGLQGNFYFLPITIPYFWFIILTYYSFKKDIMFSLIANLIHVLILSSFTSLSISLLLICVNFLTFVFATISERFHTSTIHMVVASGAGTLFFSFLIWTIQSFNYDISQPSVLSWFGSSIMTLILSAPLILFLQSIDKKIQYERVDTLENLRI